MYSVLLSYKNINYLFAKNMLNCFELHQDRKIGKPLPLLIIYELYMILYNNLNSINNNSNNTKITTT